MDRLFFPGALFAALITAGCVLIPAAGEKDPVGSAALREGADSREEDPGGGIPGQEPGGGSLPWEDLPPEPRAYLRELAGAFSRQDAAFLLAQGESQFEAEIRPRYDEEEYLALLYRAGSYGQDKPYDEEDAPRLDVLEISGLEYTGWEERGPLLEVRGRLVRQGGRPPVPCVIMLLWKLWEPKILGRFP
ncbi:MAG: hypothetical protein LBH51_08160 [Treponema sp.]|jgi:hypothetical protein|nr:hypothetical protein [Treponema sp.]